MSNEKIEINVILQCLSDLLRILSEQTRILDVHRWHSVKPAILSKNVLSNSVNRGPACIGKTENIESHTQCR